MSTAPVVLPRLTVCCSASACGVTIATNDYREQFCVKPMQQVLEE
ncbi:hypothetical protein [Undibacterium sp. CY21W]|nr:hypothetical protein [Undibacterium sp. CY21W]